MIRRNDPRQWKAMTNRRQFLKTGIAAGVWPLAAGAAHPGGGDGRASAVPLYRVVYDRRFAEGVAFARRAASLGLPLRAIEGDMTRFWYEDLYHAWRRGPVAIAGLTAHGPLFCLEQLARDQRMRVVFRAEHRPADDGVEHTLNGPLTMLRRSLPVTEAGSGWSECMAEVISACPGTRTETASARLRGGGSVSAGDGSVSAGRASLFSWVIAPVGRTHVAARHRRPA